MRHAALHRRVFLPLLVALVALAWALLWAWSLSPYAGYLAHEDWRAAGPVARLCRAMPAGAVIVPAALSVLAWLLMSMAMMLPTTLPLFEALARLTEARADRGRLLLLLGLGYLAVWGLFGVLVHGLHALLLLGVDRLPLLSRHAWLLGVATLSLAGAFQFSRLKHLCLEQCRTPLSFVIRHWRGRRRAWQAFALGAHHGLFCIGCCWALMLLMFVVGMGHLGWMLMLAAVMGIEKNFTWGRRLSTPLGLTLLAAAAALLLARL